MYTTAIKICKSFSDENRYHLSNYTGHIPEDSNVYNHRHDNLKFYILASFLFPLY